MKGDMTGSIRILLVDDHQAVRQGLRKMLEGEGDIEVVAEAASGEEALALAALHSPNIALIDIKMPGMDGIEATRRFIEVIPSCSIIILTLYRDYLVQAMQAGAVGYIVKDINREELVSAIRVIHSWKFPLFRHSDRAFVLVKL